MGVEGRRHGEAEQLASWWPGSRERMPQLTGLLFSSIYSIWAPSPQDASYALSRSYSELIVSGNILTDTPRGALY
jgi:hypothetical protein